MERYFPVNSNRSSLKTGNPYHSRVFYVNRNNKLLFSSEGMDKYKNGRMELERNFPVV